MFTLNTDKTEFEFGLNLHHHASMNISVLHYLAELIKTDLAVIILEDHLIQS